MIRPANEGIEVWLCVEPVDFRKQITLRSRSPSPSTSDTVAQPASRYPPRIGAITPSSETTTAP